MTAPLTTQRPQPIQAPQKLAQEEVVPVLEQGDHLTRDEFERRYEAMPRPQKAELIEGVVHMPSPVRFFQHATPQSVVDWWLVTYWMSTPGVFPGAGGTVRLDLENEPQPDALLVIDPACGGQAQFSPEDYVAGGPELAVEVSASSVSIDLNSKFRVYRRNGVREYLVWRIQDQAIDWFVLRQGNYDRLALNAAGHYQSDVFPGLWLDPAALTRFDLTSVLQVLQQGLSSPEHAAFVAKLQQARKPAL